MVQYYNSRKKAAEQGAQCVKNDKMRSTALAVVMLIVVFSAMIVVLSFVLSRVAPDVMRLLENGDQAEIEAYVRGVGNEGLIVVFVLQYLQALSVVLPAMPVQITAGVVFGTLRGTIVCHLAFLLGNLTAFWVARTVLGKAVRTLLSGSKLSFIEHSPHPGLMVVIASMVPVVPNGIIPYGAAAAGVSAKTFAKGIAVGSLPSILIFCAVGSNILSGEYLLAAVLCTLETVLVVVMMLRQEQVMELYLKVRRRLRP